MSKKILIVDDDLDIVKLLGARLKKHNYNVVAAFDAVGAVTQAQNEDPDLIILDIKIPAGSGMEVCKTLKGSTHTCLKPVIVITALSSPELKNEAINAGVEAFIRKPFDFKELLSVIRRVLEEDKDESEK